MVLRIGVKMIRVTKSPGKDEFPRASSVLPIGSAYSQHTADTGALPIASNAAATATSHRAIECVEARLQRLGVHRCCSAGLAARQHCDRP